MDTKNHLKVNRPNNDAKFQFWSNWDFRQGIGVALMKSSHLWKIERFITLGQHLLKIFAFISLEIIFRREGHG